MTLSKTKSAAETEIDKLRRECDAAKAEVVTLQDRLRQFQGKMAELEHRRNEDVERSEASSKDVVARLRARVGEVEEALRRADATRRRLHNALQDLKGNIRVVARIRPCFDHGSQCLSIDSDMCTVAVQPQPRKKVDGSIQPTAPQRYSHRPSATVDCPR